MPDVVGFQVYLLSKMTAVDLTEEALTALGITTEQMTRAAHELAQRHRLDEIVHPATAYEALLGAPAIEHELDPAEVSDVYAGSRRLGWRLPLWQDLFFVVHSHPDGYAWGVGFRQCAAAGIPDAVRPWRFASNQVLSRADDVCILEEWTDTLEAELTFDTGRATQRWLARFDLGLLQRWEPR
jgi:hypothetical protein